MLIDYKVVGLEDETTAEVSGSHVSVEGLSKIRLKNALLCEACLLVFLATTAR